MQKLMNVVQSALIHNPNSRKNAQDKGQFVRMARQKMGDFCVSALNDSHLPAHLTELKSRGVDLIAISGGDGTVSACLTAIASVYHDCPLPSVAILPSGNTNLIAGDVGFGLHGEAAIDRLLRPEGLKSCIRTPIRLSWPDEERPSVLGMFGGCTGYARAVRIAHSPNVLKFAPHDLAVFFTLFSSMASLLFRRSRHSWMNGDRLSWSAEGTGLPVPGREGRSFLFMTTALEKLSHGIWPFWNEDTSRDGFHFLDVHAFPEALPKACFNLLRGRAPEWLRAHKDYTSATARAMQLETDSDFVLDGEVFPVSAGGRLKLEEGPAFRFVHV